MIVLQCVANAAAQEASNRTDESNNGNRFYGDPFADPVYFLRAKSVQKELSLADEQISKIDDLVNDYKAYMRTVVTLALGDRVAAMKKQHKIDLEKLGTILTPAQQKRLNEISVQLHFRFACSTVYLRPDVVKQLALSEEQTAALLAIVRMASQENTAILKAAKSSPELNQREAEFYTDVRRQLSEVLTDEQRKQFDAMLGKRFESDLSDLPPGLRELPGKR